MADDTPQDATPSEVAPETGQTDNGKGGKEAVLADLAKERNATKAAERQLAELAKRLQDYEDRDKTEAQKLAERAEQAERELSALRVESLRARVALNKGVPADLVEFLTGTDEESLNDQAERLLSRLAPSAPPRPSGDIDQGTRTTPHALNGDPLLEGLKQSLGLR